jgi:hypothetical protein
MIMSDVTGIDGPGPKFERIGVENGGFWYARQLMTLLGYENYNTFQKPIGRAISTFTTLEIPISEGFVQTERLIEGASLADYKLTLLIRLFHQATTDWGQRSADGLERSAAPRIRS